MADDMKMPLTAHLEELRSRLIRSLIAIGAAFLLTYGFAEWLFAFLTRPLLAHLSEEVALIGTGVTEAFFTKLKVSLIAAVFIASPVVFYQLWKFVAPGLYKQEKHYARPFVFFATLFFLLGAGFCYAVVFPVAFAFFISEFGAIGVDPALRISEYLSFTSRMLLAFGTTFELPVITYFLARLGILTYRTMLGWARYALVVIFILAAILTPADAASQVLMAVPLAILYAISIGVAYVAGKKPEGDSAGDSSDVDGG